MLEVFTSPKMCASTTLENLKWQIEPSTLYWHVHFNNSSNSHKHGWQLSSQNHHTCSRLHDLYSTCSKCLSPARIKIWDVDELKRALWTKEQFESCCSLTCGWRCGGSVYVLAFCYRKTVRTYNVYIMLLTTRSTILEEMTAIRVCSYSMIH